MLAGRHAASEKLTLQALPKRIVVLARSGVYRKGKTLKNSQRNLTRMVRKTLKLIAPTVFLMLASGIAQISRQSAVLSSPIDRTTAVSFFWFGDMESHWREPMNFYVASASDPKLHTVSMEYGVSSKGVETWITTSEMQILIERLSESHLQWTDSKTVSPFKPWSKRTDGHDSFDITVVSSKGTASAGIRLARMCDELLAFDSAMPTPRLQWQFQTLRWDDGCVIAGYHNEAKPKD